MSVLEFYKDRDYKKVRTFYTNIIPMPSLTDDKKVWEKLLLQNWNSLGLVPSRTGHNLFDKNYKSDFECPIEYFRLSLSKNPFISESIQDGPYLI